jgi:hypothetical protein
MNLWIVLFSILLPVQPQTAEAGIDNAEPMRYRGIEQLLAKFEAEAK